MCEAYWREELWRCHEDCIWAKGGDWCDYFIGRLFSVCDCGVYGFGEGYLDSLDFVFVAHIEGMV